jgi:peptidoglycan/LPS O-acetylase OafA/YrhL
VRRFYLPQLDSIRFFAFFLVFIHHAGLPASRFPVGSLPYRVLDFLHEFGWMGVDLFLVLSAFLITSLLLLEHGDAGRIALRDFYVRRILRIWPLYYLMMAIAFIILPIFGLFGPQLGAPAWRELMSRFFLPYVTLFGNFAVGHYGFPSIWTLAHMWTVTLEEQFYLVWPMVLIVLLRRPRAAVAITLPVLLLGTIGVRWYLLSRTGHPAIWTNTLARLDPLLVGIGLAFYREGRTADRHPVISAGEFLLGCAAVATIALAPNITAQTASTLWQYLATAVGFGLIVDSVVSAGRGPLLWLFTRKTLVWLGRLTYGLYVYHILGILTAHHILARMPAAPKTPRLLAWLLPFALGLVLTVAMAAVSYYAFEKHLLKLKNRFAHVLSTVSPSATREGKQATSRENEPATSATL